MSDYYFIFGVYIEELGISLPVSQFASFMMTVPCIGRIFSVYDAKAMYFLTEWYQLWEGCHL